MTDIDLFKKNERAFRSPCCGARIQIAFQRTSTQRETLVYECLQCARLYVVDSRDRTEGGEQDGRTDGAGG